MENYVAFIEIGGSLERSLGFSFDRIRGYLDSFVDQDLITDNVTQTEIWKSEDIGRWFYGDNEIKERVLSLEYLPERYSLIRAEVINKDELDKRLSKFCERFGFLNFYYKKSDTDGKKID